LEAATAGAEGRGRTAPARPKAATRLPNRPEVLPPPTVCAAELHGNATSRRGRRHPSPPGHRWRLRRQRRHNDRERQDQQGGKLNNRAIPTTTTTATTAPPTPPPPPSSANRYGGAWPRSPLYHHPTACHPQGRKQTRHARRGRDGRTRQQQQTRKSTGSAQHQAATLPSGAAGTRNAEGSALHQQRTHRAAFRVTRIVELNDPEGNKCRISASIFSRRPAHHWAQNHREKHFCFCAFWGG